MPLYGWERVLELAQSGDVGKEHRAVVQAWTLLREEDFPPLSTWSVAKTDALAAVDALHQKHGGAGDGFVRDLTLLVDAVLKEKKT